MRHCGLFAAALALLAPAFVLAELRITEVCARCQPNVVARKDLGWVELWNDGDKAVNLRDYKLVGTNRGKKVKSGDADISPLLDRMVAPGAYALVYTSEMFPNGEDGTTVAEYDYGAYGRIMVVPKKLNQKKYPMVQLMKGKKLLQTVCVPVDLADEASYATYPSRLIASMPTPGAANVTDGIPYGPNVSCLYGVKDAVDPWQAFPQAKAGVDYAVRFPVNPIDLSEADDDRIASVRLIYRVALGAAVTNDAPMRAVATNKTDGVIYEGIIPGAALTAAGQLVQFAALVTDGAGRVFRSPSFCNPDDGYEWYGTIVEPGELDTPSLQTFHLFADAETADTPGSGIQTVLMNIDSSSTNYYTATHPYGGRVGIYDSRTGLYHDNVRIDRRGNTSAAFKKLSHGLRFSKAQPIVFSNAFTQAEIECRKSSLVSEYTDPSLVRQSLSFKVFRDLGNHAPFHYPVRVNLNGQFYQLAFHSERFTDELIEDHYGLDPLGYGYKNVGYMKWLNTSAGTIEKKTPDDGHEEDLSELSALLDKIRGTSNVPKEYDPADETRSLLPSVTKTVVKSFDLPAWLNYLAATRLTHETDDYKANLSLYYDAYGTGTWMPLCYDLQLSWGQYWGKGGTRAADDSHESHPLFGGYRVGGGNCGFEAVWQCPKFRRLYLRRLRTVMDKMLKEPGTLREDTPFWSYVVAVTNATAAIVAQDQKVWRPQSNAVGQPMHNWAKWMSVSEAEDDLWNNYVEPRRCHLYVTHAATNTARATGYAQAMSAGIPPPQAPTAELKAGLSIVAWPDGQLVRGGVLVVSNANAVAVDLSGWKLSKAVKWTLPAGTVVDAHDTITFVADRKRYVAAHARKLTDQVIVGNMTVNDVLRNPVVLKDADGVKVFETYPPPVLEIDGAAATPGTDYCGSSVVVTLGEGFAENGRKVTAALTAETSAGPVTVKGTVDLAAKTITFALGRTTLSAAELRAGTVRVTAGDFSATYGLAFEQGTVTATGSSGWIDESAATLGTTGTWSAPPQPADGVLKVKGHSDFVPNEAMSESAVATITSRLALGCGDTRAFDPDAHAGVMAVPTAAGDRYAFKTADGVVTNMDVRADVGGEVEVTATVDYRLARVSYFIDGHAFGPFPIAPTARRTSALNLYGDGALASLAGDYETRALDTDLACIGESRFATVADAVAAGIPGAIGLLWDASWTPPRHGKWLFAPNGHKLQVVGAAGWRLTDNGDGTVTVSWQDGTMLIIR